MKKINLILMMLLISTTSLLAQYDANPFVQNSDYIPNPYILEGTKLYFNAGDTSNFQFRQGMTTLVDYPVPAAPGTPLVVVITIKGWLFRGTIARDPLNLAASILQPPVPAGGSPTAALDYAQYFNWTKGVDANGNDILTGTQNATLIGSGGDPLNPVVGSVGDMRVQLMAPAGVPTDSLYASVELFLGSTMNPLSNTTADDKDIIISASLPLQLIDFGVAEHNCNALLSWTTAQEQNTSHMDIYRRDENAPAFAKIATLKAAGNSVEERSYTYLDKAMNVNSKSFEYYIRFVDIDGQYTQSEVQTIRMNCLSNNSTIKLFPNPVTGQLNVLYNSEVDDVQLKLEILDLMGRTVATQTAIINSGNNLLNFNTKGLAIGNYFLRHTNMDDNKSSVIKFTKE